MEKFKELKIPKEYTIATTTGSGHTFTTMFEDEKAFHYGEEGKNPLYIGRKKLSLQGINLVSMESTLKNGLEPDICLYCGKINYTALYKFTKAKHVYMAFEPPCVEPFHSLNKTRYLSKIFDYVGTWNDDIVDDIIFIKFNYPNDLSIKSKKKIEFKKKGLITNISSNKKSSHPDELYSLRVAAIKYFQENEKTFKYYGVGWEKGADNYGGGIESKIEVYPNFKFALCFENQKNIKGYVTEKIFDCMLGGVVPIYYGANNICDYIPADCFIDYRKFQDFKSLHKYLVEMSEEEYNVYTNRMEQFIKDNREGQFSEESFVKFIMEVVKKDKRIINKFHNLFIVWWLKNLSMTKKLISEDGFLKYFKKVSKKIIQK